MTEDAIEPPPETLHIVIERVAELEQRVQRLEQAIAKAFGKYWLEEQAKGDADVG